MTNRQLNGARLCRRPAAAVWTLLRLTLRAQPRSAKVRIRTLTTNNVICRKGFIAGDICYFFFPTGSRYANRKYTSTTPTSAERPPQNTGQRVWLVWVQAVNHQPVPR